MSRPYEHPKTISDFERIYREEYNLELSIDDKWIRWATEHGDPCGVNFYEGMKAAHIFNNIKMEQLLRIFKHEPPNV